MAYVPHGRCPVRRVRNGASTSHGHDERNGQDGHREGHGVDRQDQHHTAVHPTPRQHLDGEAQRHGFHRPMAHADNHGRHRIHRPMAHGHDKQGNGE